jgi:DNA-directed RNA polymerase specialized sigma24 family protein
MRRRVSKKRDKTQKQKHLPIETNLTHDEIMAYAPLVTKISLYFFRLNKDKKLEFDDIYQTAWVGFLKGANKYDSNRGVTLGAYCRSWCWGAVYRSILGSRAVRNAKLKIGYPVHNVMNEQDFMQDIDLHDFINSLHEPNRTVILLMQEGYKIREIVKKTKLLTVEVKIILNEFETQLMEA